MQYEYAVNRFVGLGATILALGPCENLNWSLKPIQNQQSAINNTELATQLGKILFRMRARKAYAPNVVPASAHVADLTNLTEKINLGYTLLFRQQDCHADGIFLSRSNAFVMSSAGCPVIIATDRAKEHMVVAHASRDSLIDRGAVCGIPSRKHLSIVDSIVEAFSLRYIPSAEIEMRMFFSIPTNTFGHSFSDPVFGKYNFQLGEFVKKRWGNCTRLYEDTLFLDLERLFVAQADQAKIRSAECFESLSLHPELAHTRDGKDPSRRNLIIVRRN